MEKEFVPYDSAFRLKALGFDEPCWCYFLNGIFNDSRFPKTYEYFEDMNKDYEYILAPTFSQVFRWFREKYQIFPEVLTDCTTEPKFVFTYNQFLGNPKDLTEQEWGWENNIGQYSDIYRTYEDAELACLEKLIEIIENK